MKKNKVISKMLVLILFIAVLVTSFMIISNAATDSAFEKSIEVFPESYRPYLRELHKTYPNWVFEPVVTNMDWQGAVDAQYTDDKALMENNKMFSEIFKSKLPGDYNSTYGYYIEKDGGFVTASKLALSYYMDPRNFLNVQGIFQFEDLSFDETFTISDVELVLKGNFMSNKNADYLNSSGVLVKSNYTYAQLIFAAGKKYDINPCYLAAKIINEIGNGSGSVSGTYYGYRGIYNFYNIGATDGANAIGRGLAWASSGGSYGRPWTSPYKSIYGGAEFISKNYFTKGQHTGYLQRFNVNPNAAYPVHTHQYMSNVSGAMTQGYSTYLSYLASGKISDKYVFSIPVYKNMSSEKSGEGDISLYDTANSYGKTNTTSLNVRTGPSTLHSTLSFKISYGTNVKILDQVVTDADYYVNVLYFPYWAKIQFTLNSKTYTGYVPMEYIDLSSYTNVSVGKQKINAFKSDDDVNISYISSNNSIAVVNSDNTVTFLKPGKVTITAYDSFGKYDTALYNVTSSASSMLISGLSTSVVGDKLQIKYNINSNVSGYEVFTFDEKGNKVLSWATKGNIITYDLSKLGNSKYVFVRGVKYLSNSINSYGKMSYCPVGYINIKKPEKVKISSATSNYNDITVKWSPVDSASGYRIYQYINGSWVGLENIWNANANSYTFDGLKTNAKYSFAVRAFTKSPTGQIVWGDPSYIYSVPTKSVAPKISSSTSGYTDITINWNKVSGVDGYRVYIAKNGVWVGTNVLGSSTTSMKFTGLTNDTTYRFVIRSFMYRTDKSILYSDLSQEYQAKTNSIIPKISSSTSGYTDITLNWNKNSSVDGYRVYVVKNGAWVGTNIFGSSVTSMKFSGLAIDTTYRFKIRSFVFKADKSVVWSSLSEEYKASTKPPIPQFTSSIQGANEVTLKWGRVPTVSGYRVYSFVNNKWVGVNVFGGYVTSYTVKNLKAGTNQRFKIRTFTFDSNGKVIWSDLSKEYNIKTIQSAPRISAMFINSTDLTFKWTEISGVDGYRAYILKDGVWEKVNLFGSNKTSCQFKNLKSDTSYTLALRYFIINDDKTITWSELSECKVVQTK